MHKEIEPGSFDIVLTNPPFGKKIVVEGESLIAQFELGRKWRRDEATSRWKQSAALRAKLPPQIPFLERCIQLLKPGGRLGIVLPESVFGNPSHGYIMQWLRTRLNITAIISMPESLFKTSGKSGTHTRVCVLIGAREEPRGDPIFMAEAEWCGHDSRGNPTVRTLPGGKTELLDEVPEIADRFLNWRLAPDSFEPDRRGFPLEQESIVRDVLIPRYYDPDIAAEMERLGEEFRFVTLDDLLKCRALSFATGVEVGKMAYGTGRIPFIRTSDISNWEIKADFKHGVSEEIHERSMASADVQAGDILMVRDGSYLIGSSAIVTEFDVPMLFQSHIYRIRVLKPEIIDPWLLFALLNSPIVARQVRAKRFTQDIIDTIGRRVFELAIPVPRSRKRAQFLAQECRRIITTRVRLRHEASALTGSIGAPPARAAEAACG